MSNWFFCLSLISSEEKEQDPGTKKHKMSKTITDRVYLIPQYFPLVFPGMNGCHASAKNSPNELGALRSRLNSGQLKVLNLISQRSQRLKLKLFYSQGSHHQPAISYCKKIGS